MSCLTSSGSDHGQIDGLARDLAADHAEDLAHRKGLVASGIRCEQLLDALRDLPRETVRLIEFRASSSRVWRALEQRLSDRLIWFFGSSRCRFVAP